MWPHLPPAVAFLVLAAFHLIPTHSQTREPMELQRFTRCQCCGAPIANEAARKFPSVRGPVKLAIALAIEANPGIDSRGLMQLVYAGPDGGPTNRNIINVLMVGLRKQLAKDGFAIDSSKGRGGGYRLRAIA